MTRKQLRRAVALVICAYVGLGLIAVMLRLLSPLIGNSAFDSFRDIIPFLFAIPAALLGYAFQQRGSYLASLRALWTRLVLSVNGAIQYTLLEAPTAAQYAEVLTQLAIAIDEVRGVYSNVHERPGVIGLYPYEPIKTIYRIINDLGYGSIDPHMRKAACDAIIHHWQSIRLEFLSEFDRAEPTKPITKPLST